MLKKLLSLFLLSLFFFTSNSQTLNWHVTAQAGTDNSQFQNYQGAFLAGFHTAEGQQLSFGPVLKGYTLNTESRNIYGGRIYSQAKVLGPLSMYLQCDVFTGTRSTSPLATTRSTMRLESGAGILYTYQDKVGISAGYNLGELNPLSGVRKNTPSIKLIYFMPFSSNRW